MLMSAICAPLAFLGAAYLIELFAPKVMLEMSN